MRRRNHALSLFLLVCVAVAIGTLAGVSTKRPSDDTAVYFPRAAEGARPTGTGDGTNGRIINGTKAAALTNASRWRSMSFLLHYDARGGSGACGGTFVTARRIVTAAHCLYAGTASPTPATTWFATSGRASVADIMAALRAGKKPAEIPALIPVRSYVIHPQYNRTTFANDVAVLEVPRDAALQPTLLAGASEAGTWGGGHGRAIADAAGPWIAGWGRTDPYDNNSASDDLLEARVPIWSDGRCAEAYGTTFQRAVMTCGSVLDTSADWNTNGVDSCQGDSGGPLLAAAADGSMRLVGITSFGIGCAGSYYPGIYTRVDAVRAWIEGITGPVSGTTNMPAVAPTPPPAPAPAPAVVGGGGNAAGGGGDVAGGEANLALTAPKAGSKIGSTGSTVVSWVIPTGVRATEVTLDADSGASATIPVPAGATSVSVPNSRFARGSTYLCVESVLERDGGYFASACARVTKGAQFSAGITSAMYRNGRITLNGRIASTSKNVTVKVRIAGGGRTANAKALSVSVPAYPRSRGFKVSVPWSGKPPRQLQATTTVAGAGEKKTFRTTLR